MKRRGFLAALGFGSAAGVAAIGAPAALAAEPAVELSVGDTTRDFKFAHSGSILRVHEGALVWVSPSGRRTQIGAAL
jgi:hypothetical protein